MSEAPAYTLSLVDYGDFPLAVDLAMQADKEADAAMAKQKKKRDAPPKTEAAQPAEVKPPADVKVAGTVEGAVAEKGEGKEEGAVYDTEEATSKKE